MTWRLTPRRTRLVDPRQLKLWPDRRHHAFVTISTNGSLRSTRSTVVAAVVELTIRDVKEGAGPEHAPSDGFTPTRHDCKCPCSPQS